MLTTECSKPRAKNVMIGSHIAAILPKVERETRASIAPIVTIQLQRIALTKAVPQPCAQRRVGDGFLERSLSKQVGDRVRRCPVCQFVIAR